MRNPWRFFTLAVLLTLLAVLVLFTFAGSTLGDASEPVPNAALGTVNIPATDDTWIEAADAGSKYGTSTGMFVRKTYESGQNWYGVTLLRFDVAAHLPPGALIDSATLTLHEYICLLEAPLST